jgi:flagellar biosynthesis activator protein FlaF
MQNAASAYGNIAKNTSSPRELEAGLLLKAASRLEAVKRTWERDQSDLDGALRYNRKLWTIFMSSVSDADHPLPTEIRQNVANLAMFIMNQTMTIVANPKVEQIDSLISINRELAAGLLGRA